MVGPCLKERKAQQPRAAEQGSVRQRLVPDCFLTLSSGHTPGAWVLTGSAALTILCSQWMLQKRGHPSAERPHLQTASTLQTLLSDVGIFGQATGSQGCCVCLSLVALLLMASSQLRPVTVRSALPSSPLLSSGREDRTHQGLHFYRLYRA